MDLTCFKPKKILLYHTFSNIGDIVLSSPLPRALKKAYPTTDIDLMVLPKVEEIARYIPYIHQVIVYDKQGVDRSFKQLFKLRKHLRNQNYDLAITTSNSTRSAIITWISGACFRIGDKSEATPLFLTNPVNPQHLPDLHQSKYLLEYLRPLGIPREDSRLELQISPEDIQKVQSYFSQVHIRPRITICSVACGAHRNWPVENCSKLIQSLRPYADLYLVGTKTDKTRLEEINRLAGGFAHVLAGTLSIGELIAFIHLSDLLITVDTGTLHIGTAVGTKVIGLFGSGEPLVWGPQGQNDIVIHHRCNPCIFSSGCRDNRCMKAIKAEEVFTASMGLLKLT